MSKNQELKRETVDTKEAAEFLNRKPQTLHRWAQLDKGPIKPIKIGGKWAWRIADLKKLVEGCAE